MEAEKETTLYSNRLKMLSTIQTLFLIALFIFASVALGKGVSWVKHGDTRFKGFILLLAGAAGFAAVGLQVYRGYFIPTNANVENIPLL
jgi:hypothetical protein